jgi:pyruvate/2-oxoglutarate dehydrogenase complex dihydrolipoamide acyltransferase (E2) component
VVRTPSGGRRGYGPTHSQSPEHLVTGVPGLTVVYPSHRHDAGALLEHATLDWDDPVVFFEHKLLYGLAQDQADYEILDGAEEASVLFPTLVRRRMGDPDLTLVTYGGMLDVVERAARALDDEEISVEIVAPSLLQPLPRRTLLQALGERSRVAILEESPYGPGFGSELLATLLESGFRGRVRRFAPLPVPIPAARSLEASVLPEERTLFDGLVSFLRLTRILVSPGEIVNVGDVVAEVETEKTSFTVEADASGIVLATLHQVGDLVDVGSVLLWLGDSSDDAIPPASAPGSLLKAPSRRATMKAAQLIKQHGLDENVIPTTGARITAADVEQFVESRVQVVPAIAHRPTPRGWRPTAGGAAQPLTPEERAMMRAVLWQREEAVPAYVELDFDSAQWSGFAARYRQRERLLFDPLLALMAQRLVAVVQKSPRLSSTIVDNERWVYHQINLGFTVQSGDQLYMTVVDDASALTCRQFVDRIFELQRKAFGRRLDARETSGATVAFSSMARWNVSRHIPVLPPGTPLIVAHATTQGSSRLGATYDHRVLTGYDAVSALSALATPEETT